MRFERGGHGVGVLVVPGHAQRHRLQAAAQSIGRLGVEDAAHEPACRGDGIEEPTGPRQHTRSDIAVTVEVLGGALHRDVHSHGEHRLVQRRGKRVVSHRGHASGAARLGHLPHVHTAQRRVDRRFEPDQARLRANHACRVAKRLERHETSLNPEPRQQVRNQVIGAAVDGGAAHHFVTLLQQRQQRMRRGGLSRAEQDAHLGTVHRGHLPLDGHHRRVLVARVQVAGLACLLIGLHLRRRIEDERARLVDRSGERRRLARRHLIAGVNQFGAAAHVLCSRPNPSAHLSGRSDCWLITWKRAQTTGSLG